MSFIPILKVTADEASSIFVQSCTSCTRGRSKLEDQGDQGKANNWYISTMFIRIITAVQLSLTWGLQHALACNKWLSGSPLTLCSAHLQALSLSPPLCRFYSLFIGCRCFFTGLEGVWVARYTVPCQLSVLCASASFRLALAFSSSPACICNSLQLSLSKWPILSVAKCSLQHRYQNRNELSAWAHHHLGSLDSTEESQLNRSNEAGLIGGGPQKKNWASLINRSTELVTQRWQARKYWSQSLDSERFRALIIEKDRERESESESERATFWSRGY